MVSFSVLDFLPSNNFNGRGREERRERCGCGCGWKDGKITVTEKSRLSVRKRYNKAISRDFYLDLDFLEFFSFLTYKKQTTYKTRLEWLKKTFIKTQKTRKQDQCEEAIQQCNLKGHFSKSLHGFLRCKNKRLLRCDSRGKKRSLKHSKRENLSRVRKGPQRTLHPRA